MDYSFAYFIGELIMFFPAFLLFFLWRKDLRKEMVVAGLTFGVIAFLSEPIFILHYWHPEYIFPLSYGNIALGSMEDFLYGFLKGGIAAVIFEVLCAKGFCIRRIKTHHWNRVLIPVFGAATALFIVPVVLWSWNPVYTSVFTILVFLAALLLYRSDLVPEACISGVLVTMLTFIGFKLLLALYPGLIEAWWKLDNLSGIMLSGIPIEEMLESFVVGFFGGPFYEFFNGLRLKKYRPAVA